MLPVFLFFPYLFECFHLYGAAKWYASEQLDGLHMKLGVLERFPTVSNVPGGVTQAPWAVELAGEEAPRL